MIIALVGVALAAQAGAAQAKAEPAVLTSADYDRATRFLRRNAEREVLNAAVTPHWLPGGGDRFWYRRQTAPDRAIFQIVDPAAGGRRTPAFDHAIVATGLAAALGKPVAPDTLPFKSFRFGAKGMIEAVIDGKIWACSTVSPGCTSRAAPTPIETEVASPDGKWLAFVKDDNIWIRPAEGGAAFALTTDGVPDNGWATEPGVNDGATKLRLAGKPYPPALIWSPDSRRIFTQRVDDRRTGPMGLLQSVPPDGSVRPKLHSWRMPQPGDAAIPASEPWIFEIASRTGVKLDVPPIPIGLYTVATAGEAWWSKNGTSLSLFARDRYTRTMTLYRVDAASGAARPLITETGRTFVESGGIGMRPMVETLASGEMIWFSERDGHGRLYLYGADGQVKRVLGTGPGQITRIVRFDEAARRIYVRANGREGGDPYPASLYRIDLDSGAMRRLTPEAGDHGAGAQDGIAVAIGTDPMSPPGSTASVSPSGRYFVDSYSTVETPPVSVLRRADGALVTVLERADISPLKAGGFTPPEGFTATAADGRTTLYGAILRPSNFDPSKRYPVIDQIYPGPQSRRVPGGFVEALFGAGFAQATAELGFIVILVDGRGTPGRDKAFLDLSYGKLANGGFLEDHVSAIRELGRSRPWMDLDRVGIYGISGGGNATARAMFAYPDFYKVGVAHAGNHNQRGYTRAWGETYNGIDDGRNYAATSNAAIAKNLKGKLLLMHGDMDSNVSPALTMQVVDALIKANKDFDMLLIPNLGHAWNGYAMRRTWDYLVTNLMGAVPPSDYAMPGVEK